MASPKDKSGHPIELEFRSRFDEATYNRVLAQLLQTAHDLGVDDKTIHFFPLPKHLLKVTVNHSKHNAKVSFKGARLGASDHFTEIEYPIAVADVDRAVDMFLALGHGELYHTATNRRRNFQLGDVEIAMKWSQAWGFHAELEILLPAEASQDDIDSATDKISSTAKTLGIHLMTRKELADFEREFEAAQRKAKAKS